MVPSKPILLVAFGLLCACSDNRPSGGGGGGGAAGLTPGGGGDGEAPGEIDQPRPDRPPSSEEIQLTVTPNPAQAGQAADVTCVVLDNAGVGTGESSVIEISPPGPVQRDGRRLLTERSGIYEVRCGVPGTSLSAWVDWTVLPAVAERMTGEAEPPIVRSGEAITPTVTAFDSYSNQFTPELQWSVVGNDTHGVTVLRNGKLRMVGSGWATVTGLDPTSGLSVEFPVGVDRDPPRIEISSPRRASFIPRPTPVKVDGRVFDDVELASFRLGGIDVRPGVEGNFSVSIPGILPGLHILATEAEDVVGRRVEGAQSFLWGDFGTPGDWTPQAVRIGVGRAFLDDDDPELDDVAALAEAFMGSADLAPGQVPLGECGGWVELSNLRNSPPDVDLTPVQGGAAAEITVRDISMDYEGEYCTNVIVIGCSCVGFHGTATAGSMVAEAQADIFALDCRPSVSTRPADVTIEELDVRLGGFASLLNPIIGLFEGTIRGRMEEAIEGQMNQLLGDALGSMLDGIALPDTFPLPPPLEGEIQVDTCFVEAAFDDDGGHLDADARFPVDTRISLPVHAGPLMSPGAPPWVHGPRPLALSVDDDLLNAMLFEAWRGGLLEDFDLISFMGDGGDGLDGPLPIPVEGLVLTALLPPVLLPVGADGDTVEFVMGMGDLQIRAQTSLGDIVMFVSIVLPATGWVDGERIAIEPSAHPDDVVLQLEVTEVPDLGGFDALLGALEELFKQQVLPLLAGEAIDLALPAIPLDALLPGQGAALRMSNTDVVMDGPDGEHITVRADLAAENL